MKPSKVFSFSFAIVVYIIMTLAPSSTSLEVFKTFLVLWKAVFEFLCIGQSCFSLLFCNPNNNECNFAPSFWRSIVMTFSLTLCCVLAPTDSSFLKTAASYSRCCLHLRHPQPYSIPPPANSGLHTTDSTRICPPHS